MQEHQFTCEIGGRELQLGVGKLAGQAQAAVTASYGDTVVLVTLGVGKDPREGVDFLPLTVDYEERLYAAGKIPGGFIRREGRPSEAATLACRQADRSIRPLLPKTWRREIQVIATVFSADQENAPDILALIGASAVLAMSNVPFEGPVGAVHIGYIGDEFVLNPTLEQLELSLLDVTVASTKKEVIMLEAGSKEVSEDLMLQAIKIGHEANQGIIAIQEEMIQAFGQTKTTAPEAVSNDEIAAAIKQKVGNRITEAFRIKDRRERDLVVNTLQKEMCQALAEQAAEAEIAAVFDYVVKATIRGNVLDNGERMGGRAVTEIRTISSEVGLLPRTHGSGLFARGLTQVMSITTLGSTRKEQMLDGLGIMESKRFMHHYNFPGFSTGEVRRVGGTSRREIGHGALAEKALVQVLPVDEEFPYAIRLVSEVLSSNGSTSMASVCAGSLSLMDAGIPMKAAVAGLAMGLITGDDGRFTVLTDIEGLEDAYGDMDFKVAGTKTGITAIQMDTKLKGLSMEVIEKTLSQARDGRFFILDRMAETIGASRSEVSRYAPRMFKISVDTDKIGAVIGPGGKTVRAIVAETKTTVDINDDGTIVIGSADMESANRAIEMIQALTKEVEVGSVYTGKVTRTLDFGAMVQILPGKEGLVHISELEDYRVGRVEDVAKIGDELTVKVIDVDNLGRINLSRRAVFETDPELASARAAERRPSRPRRDSGPGFRRSGPPNNFQNRR